MSKLVPFKCAVLRVTNRIADKYKGKNVVFLAIDCGDSREDFRKWLPQKSKYGALIFLRDSNPNYTNVATLRYNVVTYPETYVLTPDGKVSAALLKDPGDGRALDQAVAAAE